MFEDIFDDLIEEEKDGCGCGGNRGSDCDCNEECDDSSIDLPEDEDDETNPWRRIWKTRTWTTDGSWDTEL